VDVQPAEDAVLQVLVCLAVAKIMARAVQVDVTNSMYSIGWPTWSFRAANQNLILLRFVLRTAAKNFSGT
jgi:hypothetical protein